jgi:hypothetical protein
VGGNTGKMYKLPAIICTLFQNSKMERIEELEKILFCRLWIEESEEIMVILEAIWI